jgi:hypothetical protein
LPVINSGRVELLDLPKLISQLASLERRVARGGRDSIDHPKGFHDDTANSVSGAVLVALGPLPQASPMVGVYSWGGAIQWGDGPKKPHRWDGPLENGGYATSR